MELIPLKDVLQDMDAGSQFSLQFTTCDRVKKTAGKLIDVAQAFKSGTRSKATQPAPATAEHGTKSPNHYRNRTRNIVLIPSGQIRKVHIRLINFYNGKKVIW